MGLALSGSALRPMAVAGGGLAVAGGGLAVGGGGACSPRRCSALDGGGWRSLAVGWRSAAVVRARRGAAPRSMAVAGGGLAVAGGGRRRCVLAAAVLESGVTEERVDFVYTFDNIS